jgi:hypothetical protein
VAFASSSDRSAVSIPRFVATYATNRSIHSANARSGGNVASSSSAASHSDSTAFR